MWPAQLTLTQKHPSKGPVPMADLWVLFHTGPVTPQTCGVSWSLIH